MALMAEGLEDIILGRRSWTQGSKVEEKAMTEAQDKVAPGEPKEESTEGTEQGGTGQGGTEQEDATTRFRRRREKLRAGRVPPFMGGGKSGAANPMSQMLQMMPLLMATMGMGGKGAGLPGMGMGLMVMQLQVQLMVWMIETWMDYLEALQDVFERSVERLQDMELLGTMMAGMSADGSDGEDDGTDGKNW